MSHLTSALIDLIPSDCFECPEPAINYVLKLCYMNKSPINVERLFTLVGGSLDRMQERLNIGNWKDVSLVERQTVTLLCFYKILLYVQMNSDQNDELNIKIFQIIDHGLLFGAPLPAPDHNLLHSCSEILKNAKKSSNSTKSNLKFSSMIPRNKVDKDYGRPIEVQDCPSLESFYKRMVSALPLILQNCIEEWPARTLWDDPNYLIGKAGHRTVPIEIGSKYTDSDWTQKLVTFSEYVNEYILSENRKEIGYLAQHQLFDQIPELLEDFYVPDYCGLHIKDEYGEFVDKNAWFGPSGTVSPLHTDPKNNLLAQVIGEKLVILYPPEDTPYLYPHPDSLLQNTAQVDPVNVDYVKYPEFHKASPSFHVLRPGELLYIPPGWWHYVTSLSVSFSVSFWWD